MGFEDAGREEPAGPAVVQPTLRQRAEEQAQDTGVEDLDALSPEEAGRLFHELRVHQIELEMQNEELRRTQEVLEASRARYFDLYNLAPVGYVTLSEKGLILEANLTAATLLGVPRSALVNQPLTRSIVPEDQDIYYLHRNRLFETGAPQVCELRMARKDARVCQFWARLESIVVQDAESGAPIFRVTMHEITDRKRAERAVEELAHDLGERVKELNCLYSISNLVEIPGISLEEVLQGTVELIPPAWQYPEITCARIIMDGQEYSTDNFAQSPWEQAADISVHGEPCGALQVGYLQERPKSDEGPFLKEERSLLNVIAERMGKISERMRAQQRVLQQHQFLQTVLESLTHPFYVINAQSYTVELANSAAYDGKLRGDITCYALTHGNDRPCGEVEHRCPLQEVKRTNKPVVVEHVHLDKDGRRRSFEVHGFPVADPDGNVVQMIEYTLDVTERNRTEDALRDSEAKLRALFEILPVGISVLDHSRTIQLSNPALAGILCLSQDQLQSSVHEKRTYLRVDGTEMPASDFPSIQAVREQRPIRDVEVGVVKEDGEQIWTSVSAAPLPFEDWSVIVTTADITRLKRTEGALQRAHSELELRVEERTAELVELNQVLLAEITERQHVEEELRASEERFRQLADHINHVFWISDLATNQPLYVSRAYEDLWGRERQTLYEQPASFFEAVHPEDRKRLEVALERSSREERVEQFRIVRPDGSLLWVRVRAFPVRDEQGRAYRLAGIAEDINEQVQAVQLLEQRVEERTLQLAALLQFARRMTLTLELGPLLELVLDVLQVLVEYDGAVIYQLEGEELVALAHRGPGWPEELVLEHVHLVESAIAQRVLSDREPMLLSDVQGRTDDGLLTPVADSACCGMAAPLGIGQRAVGLLVLYSKRPQSYSQQQAALLLALANQAAVGIENAHLYEQAQALAVIEERQRLARDLHDAVSQTLFSANIIAEALPRIWDRDPESVRRRLPQLHRLTSGALAEMRTLLLELRPTAMVDVALSELLQQAVDAFSGRTRTAASLDLSGQRPLPAAVQIALYRIAQEALNNVVKHAKATEVKICLQNEPDRVELRIQDDGQGFEPDHIPPGCMGLNILRERARAIGATVVVSSQPGDGTEIVVVWTEVP